jgi:hypothetical protein
VRVHFSEQQGERPPRQSISVGRAVDAAYYVKKKKGFVQVNGKRVG